MPPAQQQRRQAGRERRKRSGTRAHPECYIQCQNENRMQGRKQALQGAGHTLHIGSHDRCTEQLSGRAPTLHGRRERGRMRICADSRKPGHRLCARDGWTEVQGYTLLTLIHAAELWCLPCNINDAAGRCGCWQPTHALGNRDPEENPYAHMYTQLTLL